MKPSQIFLIGFLFFFFGPQDIQLQDQDQDDDKNASAGSEQNPIRRPDFEKPAKDLISATWQAHQKTREGAPAEISLQYLFSFMEKGLTEKGKKALLSRGNIQLNSLCNEAGCFSNKGDLITLHVTLDGKTVEMDIPAAVEGRYASFENECSFTFKEPLVKVRHKVWFLTLCTTIEMVEATQKTLRIQLAGTDDLYYSFQQ